MQLRTERLLLREFIEEDWQAVFNYRQDARYLRFYPDQEISQSDAQAFVKRQIEQQFIEPRSSYQLAIMLPKSRQLIGNAGIRQRSLLPHQSDARQADIGYELDPRFWGKGYATEAAKALLDFGFEQLRMHRIWAGCLAENTASARVLEKLGMRLEGRLRDNEFFKSRWWDALIYAILDHEWQPGPENRGSAQNDSHHTAGLRFRRAIAADAPRLTEIAFAAKRYWGYPERWIVVWRDQLIITEDYVNSHQVILAENEAGISGFYGLSIDDSKAGLDYLWVDPPHIGQGIGRTLLKHACQTATSLGVERMEIIADPNAEGFYRRMGAEKIGESVYELEGQTRRLPLMVLQLDERYGA